MYSIWADLAWTEGKSGEDSAAPCWERQGIWMRFTKKKMSGRPFETWGCWKDVGVMEENVGAGQQG